MRCKSIFGVLWRSLLFLCVVFVGCVNGAEFTVTPLESPTDIAVYEVTGNYDDELSDGSNNWIPRSEIAKAYYNKHPDQYDFLIIFSNFDFKMPKEGIAFYSGVKNDVKGIGKDLFDYSSYYGSDGMLQGTIDMGNIKSMATDPFNPDFRFPLGTLSHEVLHRWAAFVGFRKSDGTISTDLIGEGGSHWSFLLDTDGSLEYGNQWIDNGNGTFTSLAGRKYLSSLDLYLMGFVGKT